MKNPYTFRRYESHILKSPTGNPLTKFVNLCQSPEDRRDKYAFARFFGASVSLATRMRDWHWPKINLLLATLQPTGQP